MKYIYRLLQSLIIFILGTGSAYSVEVDASIDWAEKRVAHFSVEGIVAEVNISQGDSFKKGDTLLALDKSVFVQKVALHRAEVTGLKPVFDDASRELDHANTLYEQTVLSDVELQKAQMSYEIAKSDLAQAKSHYRIAQLELEFASIVAPWDGFVLESHVLPGKFVSAENNDKPLLILVRSDRLKAVGRVSKSIADSVAISTKAKVEVNGKSHAAEVTDVRRNISATSKKGEYRLAVEFDARGQTALVGRNAIIRLP